MDSVTGAYSSETMGSHSQSTAGPAEYTPSDDEKKILKTVECIFEKAKKHRKQHDSDWLDYYKYFRGKQWKEARPSYRHSEVINFVFQTIQSQVPLLTDARQRIEYIAQEPSDTEFAKILDEVAESDWTAGNWTYRLAEMIYDGHIVGTGLGQIGYDPKAKFGEGVITFDSEDPFYCFPDPNARDVNVKARNFTMAEPVEIDELKREYPEKGKYVKPDLADFVSRDKADLDPVKFRSPVDNRTILEGTSHYDLDYRNKCLKVTCFMLDDDYDEIKNSETGADGTVTESFTQKLKYPNGRKVTIAGGVVLEDRPMDLDEPLFPFIRFANYIDPRCFWGISEVEQLKGPQNIFNKVYSFVLDVLTLMGNPIWVVDTDSEVDTDNLFNRPGLVIEKAKGSEVRREEGTQLQPYVLQILDRVREYIDGISGSQEVSRGAQPAGITAASAIQSLQEAAQTRIRQKSRNLDATLQDFGKLYKNYALSFYSAPRMFRITNDKGANRYFKMHISKEELPDGSVQKKATVVPYVPDEAGVPKESVDGTKEYLIRGDFDVKITTGSSLPFAKDAKFGKAVKLYELQVIDDEELLKNADYPNWEVVLQRVQEKKQAEMQAAMAAKAQQGGAPQGAPPPA